jgi:hypothetical protein
MWPIKDVVAFVHDEAACATCAKLLRMHEQLEALASDASESLRVISAWPCAVIIELRSLSVEHHPAHEALKILDQLLSSVGPAMPAVDALLDTLLPRARCKANDGRAEGQGEPGGLTGGATPPTGATPSYSAQ